MDLKPIKIWAVVFHGDPKKVKKVPLGSEPMLGRQNETRAELIADWEHAFRKLWVYGYRHGYRCVRAEVRFIEGSKP